MGEFQGSAEVAAGLLAKWGLDAGALATLATLVIFATELVKKHAGVAGQKILLVSSLLSLAICSLFYAPNWMMVFRSAFLVAIAASGGMQFTKTIAGKIGEDKFSAQPSQLTDTKPGN